MWKIFLGSLCIKSLFKNVTLKANNILCVAGGKPDDITVIVGRVVSSWGFFFSLLSNGVEKMKSPGL